TRRCGAENRAAYVTRKGDADSGAVLVKRADPCGCTVFQTIFGTDGSRRWMAVSGDAPIPEPEADAFITRQSRHDEDLWVVEIEASNDWTP
ncbi:MAG: DUF1491 family protein, partial [Rhodospirillaceae bacterium]|nr:DUF1491 family protein [Rhodospirillaceae bacterium]